MNDQSIRIKAPLLLVAILACFVCFRSDLFLLSVAPPCNAMIKTSTRREVKEVAICVMITSSSTHGPTDLAGTLDGAATLRRSVLNVYNLTDANMVKVERTVGLTPYNRNNINSTTWMKPKNETVSVFEVNVDRKTTVRLRFVAMTNDDVNDEWRNVIRVHRFEVWNAHTPMEHTEVRNTQLSIDMKNSGAVGISELIKLDGLRMHDFDSVIFVDCDVLFHRRFNELILMEENFGWTHGGWQEEKINGGFLVYSPRHPVSKHHMDQMIAILREGNFSGGGGWRDSGIGWTYGGQTVQGILPYYYFIEANKEQEVFVQQLGQKYPPAHREIDRCRFNNMVQLDKCKNIPFDSVTSNHFTGDCGKPWHCPPHKNLLCDRFRVEFMNRYREMVLHLARSRSDVNNSEALQFVNDVKDGEWCIDGKFVSVSEILRQLLA